LEEAAQRLYKEWFVDLRFPGHEDVTVVDGVPEGWKRCSLNDVITFNPKVALDKSRIKQFVPMSALSTSSMVLNSFEYTTTLSNSGSKFQNGDTLLARITPCLENGKTAFVFGIDSDEGAVGSTEYIVMRSKELNPYMVYILARTDDFRQYAVNSMSGSDGRQRVQVDKLMAYPFLRPTARLIEMFAKLADPIFTQIYTKNEQNIELQKARDLLLPKLMSGELYLAETKKADILQPLPKLSYDEFLSDLGMAARAKTVSEADLRAMYEAYLDDDAEDRD
jgi:type I restriction enzyme S subunit